MVALESARSKKKAGASAVKQEEPATAEDVPAKKEKKKKKKTRNGHDAAPTVGKTSADDGSAGKTARTTANAVCLKTEGKDGGAEHKQGSKKNQKKKMKKGRKSEDVTSGEVIVIEDGASGGERGSAPRVKKKKKKTGGRRDGEEDGAREEGKKASGGVSEALRLSSGEKETGTRRAGTQTKNGREVKTEVKTEEETGKKKKKRKREVLAEDKTETQEVPSSCKKKKTERKTEREESSSGPADITPETAMAGTAERKKKKKRKSSADLAEEGDDVIVIDGAEPANRNAVVSEPKGGKSKGADVKETKEKRRRKKREVEKEMGDKGACEEGCTPLKKNKKKKGEVPVKIEREDSDTEASGQVVFLSEKRGNTDEVNVNQARRLALQREVDLESHPKAQTAMAAGQWSSAQFDSTDQRDKFLRLMGGFKKSSQPAAASGGRANMALGKEGQQSLQQKLLGEFERAQSRRMDFGGKGAGLGFSAPSNKKFFIDVDARRSVRFDD